MASSAEALVSDLVAHRADLAEIASARDEWSAATADDQHQARMASAELVSRGIQAEPIEPGQDTLQEPAEAPEQATIGAQLEAARDAV